MNVLEGLIDVKTARLLTLFLMNPGDLYHISKASKDSKVPLATAFRIIHSLEENGYIESLKISKLSLYKLSDNKKTKALRKLL